MKSLSLPAQGHLAMLAFSALVAGSFSLGARVANQIDPAALTLVRFALAVAGMAAVAQIGPGFRRAHLAAPWRWGLLGGIYAIYFVLMFEGLKTASSVSTAAVFTLSPLLSAGFGWLLLRQVTTPRMALALAVGAAGALWVIFRADLTAFLRFEVGRGEAIYFLGCIVHAALPAAMKLTNRGEPQLVATTLLLAGGFVTLLPWGLGPALHTDWSALGPLVWVTILYVAFIASGATAFLLAFASQRLPGAKVMAYTYLVPSWVIGWELALGGNPPPAMVLGGIGLTILALLMLLKDESIRPAPAQKAPPETG
ncbi:MAG: DMT family transporter [Gemmobacter sp.]|uniref:DMT family transporter n=1 Tax=Gemmobacter sp. TaxID=1898957 RepID=UPI00391CA542